MYYAENDKLTSCAAVDKDKKNPSEINDFRGSFGPSEVT